MSTKARIQKVLAEVEAYEERGWLKGYEEGLATREKQIVDLESALEAKNQKIRELNHRKKAPKTAWEALDLAWDLAHPVKEGQVIPKGTRYLEVTLSGLRERTASGDRKITPELATVRTLDPLPDPEPDWLDAPAVLATHKDSHDRLSPSVWTRDPIDSDRWVTGPFSAHWSELTDVTPLYPEGKKA